MQSFTAIFTKHAKPMVGGLTIALLAAFAIAAPSGPKFYNDDPIAREPETQDASRVQPWKIDLFFDILLNQFSRPGLPPGGRAQNINTIDEVPDSSWFTNRILAKPMGIEELMRGPLTGDGPAPGPLTVIRAKSEGAAPGFTVTDTAGVTWFLAFDPKNNPEASTGAAVVAMRIFYALGYHQAEYYIAQLRRDQLKIDNDAKFNPPSGRLRPMTLKDIDPVLARGAQYSDGSYRVLASKLLPGKVIGGFKYVGTRPDDPNDVVPHELRRELRALQVFGAWTNLVDIKALNTMDTLIAEHGQSRVRHYLLDVGSTFGIGANGRHEWTDGYEFLFEGDKAMKRLASFGFYLQPWQKAKYEELTAVGTFEGDTFDPLLWKSRVPAMALLHARDDDSFWAARRVMAFSDDMIRAVVKAGQFSDPKAEKLIADVLIKRRNRIGQAYYARVNPLVNFTLDGSGALRFENPAVSAGIVKEHPAYKASWSEFDNRSGANSPMGETNSSSEMIQAPTALASSNAQFVMAEVAAVSAPHVPWTRPVKVTFRRASGGWQLVGLERLP